jgi:hypothetical protein
LAYGFLSLAIVFPFWIYKVSLRISGDDEKSLFLRELYFRKFKVVFEIFKPEDPLK